MVSSSGGMEGRDPDHLILEKAQYMTEYEIALEQRPSSPKT